MDKDFSYPLMCSANVPTPSGMISVHECAVAPCLKGPLKSSSGWLALNQ